MVKRKMTDKDKTRVCVLGNSHGASIKLGWELLCDQFDNVEFTFFLAQGQNMRFLEVEKSQQGTVALRPVREEIAEIFQVTSGGRSEIELQDYDLFLFYGLGVSCPALDHRLSGAVRQTAISDAVRLSITYKILSEARNYIDKPVFVAHEPLASRQLGIDKAFSIEGKYIGYEMVHENLQSELNQLDAVLLRQPVETIGDGLVTKTEYCKGSVRLNIKKDAADRSHPPNDIFHMNVQYGKKFLEYNLPKMGL